MMLSFVHKKRACTVRTLIWKLWLLPSSRLFQRDQSCCRGRDLLMRALRALSFVRKRCLDTSDLVSPSKLISNQKVSTKNADRLKSKSRERISNSAPRAFINEYHGDELGSLSHFPRASITRASVEIRILEVSPTSLIRSFSTRIALFPICRPL
jgi:hypothetical protein